MATQDYFYKFLVPVSKNLATLARDLENSVFTGPRMMLTHARAFVEDIMNRVIKAENLSDRHCSGLKDRISLLQEEGILPKEVLDAVHDIRKSGNDAAHNTKSFRYSEALDSWEHLYVLVKWYMEVYGPLEFDMPPYQDPSLENAKKYDAQELEARFKLFEEALLQKVSAMAGQAEVAATLDSQVVEEEGVALPGETVIRTITYKNEALAIPYFLRDAFLLPQRFERSERFMIALGGVQQARIMSELPSDLEGMSAHVKRYKEENEAFMFEDLRQFVDEERERRRIMQEREGELFLFFRAEYVIMTENLANTPISEEVFKGFPNFIRQMQDDGMTTVGQLPQELLILAKYERVGIGTVEKLFRQIKALGPVL